MALNDAQIRAIRATNRPIKKADGKGLYIEVAPNGSKLWRLKFRIGARKSGWRWGHILKSA